MVLSLVKVVRRRATAVEANTRAVPAADSGNPTVLLGCAVLHVGSESTGTLAA
jgi:hypothetical protein